MLLRQQLSRGRGLPLRRLARSSGLGLGHGQQKPTMIVRAASTEASAAAASASAASAGSAPSGSAPAGSTPSGSAPAGSTPAAASPPKDDSKYVGMTGAEIFHEMMVEHEVKTIFGYPGGAILPVFDAIHDSDAFDFVLCRREDGGGHMAEGLARATGKPGVVLVTSGPGATNTVTPLMDALMDGTPLVVFTGQVPTSAIGTDAFQEADVVGITRACTKWNVLVKDVSELPRRINEAFEIATSGRPGPVLVDLPKDVTAVVLKETPDSTPRVAVRQKQKVELFHTEHMGAPTPADYQLIADMVNKAERPVIYAGQGVIQSQHNGPEVLRAFAKKANVPVTTTIQGLGCFDERSPLSLKFLGMHGSAYANYSIQDADLILALGARFDDRVTGRLDTFAPEAKRAEKEGRGGIIHFEISPKNLHKVVDPTVAVLGDVGSNLANVLPLVEFKERAPWFDKIAGWKAKHPFAYVAATGEETLKPQQVIEELNTQLLAITDANPEQEVHITTGVGGHQMHAAQFITYHQPRQWISSGGSGTMGFGLPAAIGAKQARPDAIVIDIDGDASYSMTGMELITAVQYNIGCKVLLLNNDFQGMVRQWQTLFYDERYSGTAMHNPRFDKLAEACGAKGMYCRRADELSETIKEFLAYDGPVVLEAFVDKDELILPMVPAGGSLSDMIITPADAAAAAPKK